MSWWWPVRPSLPRVEFMQAQLEEAKDLLQRDSVAHDRLAFILLDNAAEVMMFRNVEALLFSNPLYERLLKQWEAAIEAADTPEARSHRDEIKAKVISKTKRAKIERSFDAKADFLVDNGRLEQTAATVLKKLHRYRNELYHRDRIRSLTVRSAAQLYFSLAVSLFERGDKYPIGEPIIIRTMEQLDAVRRGEDTRPKPQERVVTRNLRFGMSIDEAGLKGQLVAHLASRLDEIDAGIEWVSETLGFPPHVVVNLAQVHESQLPESPRQLVTMKVDYNIQHLARWREALGGLPKLNGEIELFAAFADLEDEFEPFEQQIKGLVDRLDYEIEWEAEMMRDR